MSIGVQATSDNIVSLARPCLVQVVVAFSTSTFSGKKIFLVWALILKAITTCAKNGLARETSDTQI